ncbi:MAG: hypothetical protein FWF90_10150 [Promicromonosporaceae bacterium]|nr:hypothetical protein [Promicromonosporaceae bacterium]
MEPVVVSALLPAHPPPRPSVVRPADVGGRAAWQVLVRDGALRVLADDVALAAGREPTPAARAAAIAPRVPPRAVVAGPTAVWVHAGGPGPGALHLAYRSGTHRPDSPGAASVWSGTGLGTDSGVVGGVRVTTPERTAVDVARRLPRERALPLLARLAGSGADLAAASRLLEKRVRVVGRPQARETLAAARDSPGAHAVCGDAL